jgi:NAD(P)-dependent dehydrogenase (short-subunit alcohol dehydrogenase family)
MCEWLVMLCPIAATCRVRAGQREDIIAVSSLTGKVVLVTGASRGIGEAVARRFAADGGAVAVSARTVEDGDHPLPGSITTTVRSIADAGGVAMAVAGDLAAEADRRALIEVVERELGPIDILVNNAAVTYFEPVDGFDERHYHLMFEVQVRAPFDLAQQVISGMRARGRGWILNISSGAARHPKGPPYPRREVGTVYGMCKAALERFTTGLASELYHDRIAVNVLSPSGLVATPGVVHHGLDRRTAPENVEPIEYMVEAAHALCTGDPATLTGRIAYARPLLLELGRELGV